MSLKPTADAIRNFGLACSGANRKILEEDCPGEQSKYAMIGMFVFLTAAFATLSSGYALYKGFNSVWLAAAVGVLWGIFIFNIDRFIISTIRKKEIDSDLPPVKKGGFGLLELGKAFPRLLLAVLISIVISTPLEMKYFEPEISLKIYKKNEATQDQKVAKLEEANQRLSNAIEQKKKRQEQLRDRLLDEAQGIRRPRGFGPVARAVQEQLQKYEGDLNAFIDITQKEIDTNKGEIDRVRAEPGERKNSFLESLEALSDLAGSSSSVWWAEKFISFLILVLECTPILMKIMASYGPYDSVLEAEEYIVNLNQRTIVSAKNRKANHDEAFNTSKESLILTAKEQLARDAVLNLINLVQADIDRATVTAAQKVVNNLKQNSPALTIHGIDLPFWRRKGCGG